MTDTPTHIIDLYGIPIMWAGDDPLTPEHLGTLRRRLQTAKEQQDANARFQEEYENSLDHNES